MKQSPKETPKSRPDVPGPGYYDLKYSYSSEAVGQRVYSIGRRLNDLAKVRSPGPVYKPNANAILHVAPKSEFGKSQ